MYSCAAAAAIFLTVFIVFQPTLGELELLLAGVSIPADSTVAIPDIGTNEQGRALVCRHGIEGIPPSAEIDRWYYVNDEEGDEVEVTGAEENGFTRTREQSEGSVRLERDAGVFPLEGTYKCKVNDDSITVELYWPVMDFEVSVSVLEQTEETKVYTVTCRSTGGRLMSSSLTGPEGQVLGELDSLDDQQQLRGEDDYSITVERSGGENGDVYTCTATTEGSTHTTSSVLSVAPAVEEPKSIQIPSTSPALQLTWTLSSIGAPVTHYTIHFSSNGTMPETLQHNGNVSTSGNESMGVIEGLVADGRMYRMKVEAHSVHFSSYSDYFSYTPCVVSELSLESRTHDSLSLSWNRPSYYRENNFKGLLHYVPTLSVEGAGVGEEGGGESGWLYIEQSASSEGGDEVALPEITGLEEFTNYSITIAVFDENDRICIFNSPLIVQTGLGAVESLQVLMKENAIELSWSPPPLPPGTKIIEYQVAYSVDLRGTLRTTLTTTESELWWIGAGQGDVFTLTVTPVVESGPGESIAVTVGLDYKLFQMRIDVAGKCADILENDTEVKLAAVAEQVTQAVTNSCSCDVQIGRDARFECPNREQDFILFHGTIFAPVGVSSTSLLSRLESWITSAPKLKIPYLNSVNSECRPSEEYEETPECISQESSETGSLGDDDDEEEENKRVSATLLAGVAIGSLLVGTLCGLVLAFIFCLLKKWHTHISLKRKAHGMVTSEGFEDNPRYVSTGNYTTTKPSTRTLPLLPLFRDTKSSTTFTNHITTPTTTTTNNNKNQNDDDDGKTPKGNSNKSEASTEVYETIREVRNTLPSIAVSNVETYETITEPHKVPNPMYQMVELPNKKRKESQQALLPAEELSNYEDMQQVKKEAVKKDQLEEEYVKMMPGSVTTSAPA